MSVMFHARQLSATNGQSMAQENTFTKAIRQVETLRDETGGRFLSDNQILVIFNIFDMANPQGIKAPHLGKLCSLEGPTLTRTLQTLSSEGRKTGPKALGLIYMETDPTDKRQKIIHLTSEGERVKAKCENALTQPRTQYVLEAQAAAFNVSYGGVEARGEVGQVHVMTASNVEAGQPDVGKPNIVEGKTKEMVFVSEQAKQQFIRMMQQDESSGLAEMLEDVPMRVETEEDRIERIITSEADEWKKRGQVGGLLSHDNSGVVGVHKDYAHGIVNMNDIELKPQSWVISQLIRGRRSALAKQAESYTWRGHKIQIVSPHDARGMTFGDEAPCYGIQLEGIWFLWLRDATPQEELPSFIVRDLNDAEYTESIEYLARRLNATDEDGRAVVSFNDEMDDLKKLLNVNQYKKMRNALIHVVADVDMPVEEFIKQQRERYEEKQRQAKMYQDMSNYAGLSLTERAEFRETANNLMGEARRNEQAIKDAEKQREHTMRTQKRLAMDAIGEDELKEANPDDEA